MRRLLKLGCQGVESLAYSSARASHHCTAKDVRRIAVSIESQLGGEYDDDFRCSTEVSWILLQDSLLGSRFKSCAIIQLAAVV